MNQGGPGGARTSQEGPRRARRSQQEEPARMGQEVPGGAGTTRMRPGGEQPWGDQDEPVCENVRGTLSNLFV